MLLLIYEQVILKMHFYSGLTLVHGFLYICLMNLVLHIFSLLLGFLVKSRWIEHRIFFIRT